MRVCVDAVVDLVFAAVCEEEEASGIPLDVAARLLDAFDEDRTDLLAVVAVA